MRFVAFAAMFASSSAFALTCPSFDADLGSATGAGVAVGSSCGTVDDISPMTCGFSAAEEITYKWTAPTSDFYGFSMDGSLYDTMLYVQDSSCTEIACNDDYFGLDSYVGAAVSGGSDYFINVDGYSAGCGDYTLAIDVAVAPFTLSVSTVSAGSPFTADIIGGPANGTVYLLASGTYGYTCHPNGSPCVELSQPRVVGRISTNGAGEGSLTVNAPARLPATLYLQAAVLSPADSSNLVVQ